MLSKNVLFAQAKINVDFAIRRLSLDLARSGVSQQQLADYSHVDKGNLSKILSGVVYPNFKTWCRIRLAANLLCFPESYNVDLIDPSRGLPF